MKKNEEVVRVLERWVSGLMLRSQFNEWLMNCVLSGDTWYTRLKRDRGINEAARQLVEWRQNFRSAELASSILPVARGLLHLAKADSGCTYLKCEIFSNGRIALLPRISGMAGSGAAVIFRNFDRPWSPLASEIGRSCWSLKGDFRLRGVVLVVGRARTTFAEFSKLHLILAGSQEDAPGSTACIGIDQQGQLTAQLTSPQLSSDAYIGYQLGFNEAEEVVENRAVRCADVERAIGIPKGIVSLAAQLPKLEDYLFTLSRTLR